MYIIKPIKIKNNFMEYEHFLKLNLPNDLNYLDNVKQFHDSFESVIELITQKTNFDCFGDDSLKLKILLQFLESDINRIFNYGEFLIISLLAKCSQDIFEFSKLLKHDFIVHKVDDAKHACLIMLERHGLDVPNIFGDDLIQYFDFNYDSYFFNNLGRYSEVEFFIDNYYFYAS